MQKKTIQQHYFYKVLVPVKIPRGFGGLPIYKASAEFAIGSFVKLSWRNKATVGIICECASADSLNTSANIKTIEKLLSRPFTANSFKIWFAIISWCSKYYHFNLGLMFKIAMPKLLLNSEKNIKIVNIDQKTAEQKPTSKLKLTEHQPQNSKLLKTPKLKLTEQQQQVFDAIDTGVHLIYGVTGSGKTEIYLQLAEKVLAKSQKVLILVPEIALVNQLLSNFSDRFAVPTFAYSSIETDLTKAKIWSYAMQDGAMIVVGTRSSIFLPLSKFGLIVVDEEHDTSYQSQSNDSYNARDIALFASTKVKLNVVLGSATPSLENFYRQAKNKLKIHKLEQRISKSQPMQWKVINTKHEVVVKGISETLHKLITATIQEGKQSLVFINRRGYSRLIKCKSCEFIPQCNNCSVKLHLHKLPKPNLKCHQCAKKYAFVNTCSNCKQQNNWQIIGSGTEKIEEVLADNFAVPVYRIDSDTTKSKAKYKKMLATINAGKPCIMVGTQMLSKGHNFKNLALVAVLEVDQQLYFQDYYSYERLAQLLIQVSGRAGRGDIQGYTVLQSDMPEHPFLQTILQNNYTKVVAELMPLRSNLTMAPYSNLAIIYFYHKNALVAEQTLQKICSNVSSNKVIAIGPLPCIIARRKNLYQYKIILKSDIRSALHNYINDFHSFALDKLSINASNLKVIVDPLIFD